MFWQHLRSFQDGHQLVKVRTLSNFLEMLHWETSHWHQCLISHSVTLFLPRPNQASYYSINAESHAMKRYLSISVSHLDLTSRSLTKLGYFDGRLYWYPCSLYWGLYYQNLRFYTQKNRSETMPVECPIGVSTGRISYFLPHRSLYTDIYIYIYIYMYIHIHIYTHTIPLHIPMFSNFLILGTVLSTAAYCRRILEFVRILCSINVTCSA